MGSSSGLGVNLHPLTHPELWIMECPQPLLGG